LNIFRKFVEKLKLHYNQTRITGTLHEDQYIFITTSRSVLLRMRKCFRQRCRENQNTYLCSFRKSCS